MVRLGAQVQHSGAEQAPLHAALDLQTRVGNDEFFKARNVSTVVVLTAQVLGKGAQYVAVGCEYLELLENAQPEAAAPSNEEMLLLAAFRKLPSTDRLILLADAYDMTARAASSGVSGTDKAT